MPNPLDQIRSRAALRPATIVLPEGDDPRVLAAAVLGAALGICRPIVVAPAATSAESLGLGAGVEVVDLARDPDLPRLETLLAGRLAARGLSAGVAVASKLVRDPLYYADLLVLDGRAGGAVMGARATTAETLRAALRTIGPRPG
ncbi:MAG TPA: phosphate acyltransferase, partial [Thermoanaerobaculia bacterium]|nr:phosphate acyltransferase [Thermoanaerobaculia bacterium]